MTSVAFEPLLGRLRIRRLGRGRPRTRPDRLLAGKAYSNRTIRSHLRRRKIKATIPEKSDQRNARAAKGSRGGRPVAFDTETYKDRNTVERTINKLKGFRAVAMRTDKREFVFRGTIDVDQDLAPQPHQTRSMRHALAWLVSRNTARLRRAIFQQSPTYTR